MNKQEPKRKHILKGIPNSVNNTGILLYLHGKKVFGSIQKFGKWLKMEFFYFNVKAPIEYLDTITGIRFIDDKLSAMEYGDNI